MTNTIRRTANELIPAVGASVRVRFESLAIDCTVLDAKNSYGQVRLLVTPVTGRGAQWIELGRLVATEPVASHHSMCDSQRRGSVDALPCNCQEAK